MPKRGIDVIRQLLPEPSEVERMLALDVLADTWKDWKLVLGDLLWVPGSFGRLNIRDRVHQPFYDSMIRTSGYLSPAPASVQQPPAPNLFPSPR